MKKEDAPHQKVPNPESGENKKQGRNTGIYDKPVERKEIPGVEQPHRKPGDTTPHQVPGLGGSFSHRALHEANRGKDTDEQHSNPSASESTSSTKGFNKPSSQFSDEQEKRDAEREVSEKRSPLEESLHKEEISKKASGMSGFEHSQRHEAIKGDLHGSTMQGP